MAESKTTDNGGELYRQAEDRDWNKSVAAACNTGRNLDSLRNINNLNSNTESMTPQVVLNISLQVPCYLKMGSLISFPLIVVLVV